MNTSLLKWLIRKNNGPKCTLQRMKLAGKMTRIVNTSHTQQLILQQVLASRYLHTRRQTECTANLTFVSFTRTEMLGSTEQKCCVPMVQGLLNKMLYLKSTVNVSIYATQKSGAFVFKLQLFIKRKTFSDRLSTVFVDLPILFEKQFYHFNEFGVH